MNIKIKTIPHKEQRYETCGDWFYDANSNLQIRVSEMDDPRHEFLVAFHELIEARLCDEDGVQQEDVDAFDLHYERNRLPGDNSEPGDHHAAPYHKQHIFATEMEKYMAAQLGVRWEDYKHWRNYYQIALQN